MSFKFVWNNVVETDLLIKHSYASPITPSGPKLYILTGMPDGVRSNY